MTDCGLVADVFDCSDPDQREAGLTAAAMALSRGELALIPANGPSGPEKGGIARSRRAQVCALAACTSGRQ